MTILVGMSISCMVGFVLSIPATIAEIRHRTDNLPLLVDIHKWFGRKFTPGEVFAIGLLTHLLIATLFGGLYVFLQGYSFTAQIFVDYQIASLLSYSIAFWVFVGVILFPILGLGFFGRREGRFVWLELLITHILLGVGFWLLEPLVS